jgi:hypothetical protein
MWWLVAVVAVLGAGVWVRRWLIAPIQHRNRALDDAGAFIDSLRLGMVGSVLVLKHDASERFMQLAQRATVVGSERLLYGFPDAPWSRSYFAALLERLEDSGYSYRIRRTDEDLVPRIVEVELWGDRDAVIAEATELLRVTADVLELGPEARFTMTVSGGHDHARWAWDNRAILKEERTRGGVRGWMAQRSLRSLDGREVVQAPPPSEED